MSDSIDYPEMVLRALRTVPRQALSFAAETGLPGEHHFFLTFRTTHPGVVLPRHLREAYPETMTIILQHQFWNLAVDDESFSVTLRFGGAPADLVVPYDALTEFADPGASFGLKLEAPDETGGEGEIEAQEGSDAESRAGEAGDGTPPSDANVISMDRFRKKKPSK